MQWSQWHLTVVLPNHCAVMFVSLMWRNLLLTPVAGCGISTKHVPQNADCATFMLSFFAMFYLKSYVETELWNVAKIMYCKNNYLNTCENSYYPEKWWRLAFRGRDLKDKTYIFSKLNSLALIFSNAIYYYQYIIIYILSYREHSAIKMFWFLGTWWCLSSLSSILLEIFSFFCKYFPILLYGD